jgi:hypothetical protein
VARASSGVLGFAPHSGWAAVVVLAGSGAAPKVLARERIELCDAALEGSKQPYHAIEALPLSEARRRLSRLEVSALALATQALRTLALRAHAAGATLRVAGILDSSGRSGANLAAILASHALIHTADGNHFRAALAQACSAEGLRVTRVPQRELAERAAAVLHQTPLQLRAAVDSLGRDLGPPWGADQKDAALLAWLLLGQAA